jgi:hypothetical protein
LAGAVGLAAPYWQRRGWGSPRPPVRADGSYALHDGERSWQQNACPGRGGVAIEPERLQWAWGGHDLPDGWEGLHRRLLAAVESTRAAVEGTPEGRER